MEKIVTRKNWIWIHILLAGVFLPFFFILPLSGSLILLKEEGSATKDFAFEVERNFTNDESEIRQIFKDQKLSYDFEYIRGRGERLMTRPTTRTYYEIEYHEGKMQFFKVNPSFLRKLKEIHFGHGPKVLRNFEKIFGFAFILVNLSGLVLMFGLKKMLPLFLGSFGLGVIIFLSLLSF
jgi:hypothetical protein